MSKSRVCELGEIWAVAEERESDLEVEVRMENLGVGFKDEEGMEVGRRMREREGSWRERADMALLCLSSIARRRGYG